MKKLRSLLVLVLVAAMLSTIAIVVTSATGLAPINGSCLVNNETELLESFNESNKEIITNQDITVTLTKDITTTCSLSVDNTALTIDLNGHSITFKNTPYDEAIWISADGSLTINDSKGTGKIETEDRVLINSEGGTLTINGGSFKNSTNQNPSDQSIYDLFILRASEVKINNGNFETNCGDTIFVYASNSAEPLTTLTINGGSFKTTASGYSSNMAALDTQTANTTINGGTFYSNLGAGIEYITGSLTINNCESSGMMNGLFIDNSNSANIDITLNGGTFSSWLYSADLDKLMDEYGIPEADRATYKAQFESMKKNCSGIFADAGIDLLSFLGDNACYYSENGINKVGDKDCTEGQNVTTHAMTDPTVVVTTKGLESSAKVTEGANATYALGSTDGLKVKSNIDYCWFFDGTNQIGEVLMDGETVDPANYTSASGSTIITFKSDYLNKLKAGSHEVEIISNIGGYKVSAKTTLTIAETKEDEKVAQTGDNNAIGAFVAMGVMAAAGYALVKKHED